MSASKEATPRQKAEARGDRQRGARDGPVFSAEQARQGEIILRTRTRRIIFIAGLVGLVIVAILLRFGLG